MTSKHLKFEDLSDLIDNILTDEEREQCLAHISQCKECQKEYESLLKYMSLLSSANQEKLAFPDFSQSTINIYKRREKNRLLLKVIPLIAASIIVVTGLGFIKIGPFYKSNSFFAVNFRHSDVKKLIGYIDDFQGQIIQIHHSYIDTEFDKAMLDNIEKQLYHQNIRHAIIINPAVFRNPSEKVIDDVSLEGTKRTIINDYEYIPSENKKIIVRVFKYRNPLRG